MHEPLAQKGSRQRGAAHGSLHHSLLFIVSSNVFVSDSACINRSASGSDPENLLSSLRQLLSSAVTSGDTQAASYWAYHLARTAFFTGAAVTGAVTHHLAYQAQGLLQSLGLDSSTVATNGSGTAGSSGSSSNGGERPQTPLENLSRNAQAELLNRLQEALAVYRRDLQYIQDGKYKLPWDMTDFPRHRQFNPLFILNK